MANPVLALDHLTTTETTTWTITWTITWTTLTFGKLRAAIANGEVTAGERLPPARQLAAGLDVNVNTLLRALQTLRDEGLVDMRRGRGTVVTGTAPKLARFSELAEQLVVEAKRSGLSRQQIMKLVEDRLARTHVAIRCRINSLRC